VYELVFDPGLREPDLLKTLGEVFGATRGSDEVAYDALPPALQAIKGAAQKEEEFVAALRRLHGLKDRMDYPHRALFYTMERDPTAREQFLHDLVWLTHRVETNELSMTDFFFLLDDAARELFGMEFKYRSGDLLRKVANAREMDLFSVGKYPRAMRYELDVGRQLAARPNLQEVHGILPDVSVPNPERIKTPDYRIVVGDETVYVEAKYITPEDGDKRRRGQTFLSRMKEAATQLAQTTGGKGWTNEIWVGVEVSDPAELEAYQKDYEGWVRDRLFAAAKAFTANPEKAPLVFGKIHVDFYSPDFQKLGNFEMGFEDIRFIPPVEEVKGGAEPQPPSSPTRLVSVDRHGRAATGPVLGYGFDWDDNVLIMTTKILMDVRDGDLWRPVDVTTEEFARLGLLRNPDYRLRDDNPAIGYSNFRIPEAFIADVDTALRHRRFGPSFQNFWNALFYAQPAAIITSRGHPTGAMLEGIRHVIAATFTRQDRELMAKNIRYRFPEMNGRCDAEALEYYLSTIQMFGINSKEFVERFAITHETMEQRKAMAVRAYVEGVAKVWADVAQKERKEIYVGFSDDDPAYAKAAVQVMMDELALAFPHLRLVVYETAGGKKGRIVITPTRAEPGGLDFPVYWPQFFSSLRGSNATLGLDGPMVLDPMASERALLYHYFQSSYEETGLGSVVSVHAGDAAFGSALRMTRELIEDSDVHAILKPALFFKEGADDPGIGVRPGALVRRSDGSFTLILFAGASSIHRTAKWISREGQIKVRQELDNGFLNDLALLLYVARKQGINVTKAGIVHLKSEPGVKNLFQFVPLTEEAEQLLDQAPAAIRKIQNKAPEKVLDPAVAWENRQIRAAESGGMVADDLPQLAEKLRHLVEMTLQSGGRISASGAPGAASSASGRIVSLDFETIEPALALVLGAKNGECLSVQFSAHLLGTDGMGHQEFLYEGNPHEEGALKKLDVSFARAMLAAVGENGPILVNHAPFEKARIREVVGRLKLHGEPELADKLEQMIIDGKLKEYIQRLRELGREELADSLIPYIGEEELLMQYISRTPSEVDREVALALSEILAADRFVDLKPLVKDHIYTPEMKGSYSLKAMLPALVPGMSYSGGVNNGRLATKAWEVLLKGEVPEDQQRDLRNQLAAYCSVDTLGPIHILKKLFEIAGVDWPFAKLEKMPPDDGNPESGTSEGGGGVLTAGEAPALTAGEGGGLTMGAATLTSSSPVSRKPVSPGRLKLRASPLVDLHQGGRRPSVLRSKQIRI
ncbi:MAG: DUF2779 domain-containing protein, partial [Deltaproteobacteria bacterium]|nr:DUF2779 domain-containing protein [Deltaproteobacteria bacterium]